MYKFYIFLCSVLLATFVAASPEYNAPSRDMPTTNFFGGFVFSPEIYNPSNGKSAQLPDLNNIGIGTEASIYYWLNGGAKVNMLFAQQGRALNTIIELSPYIKFQLPIDTLIGRFTPYMTIGAGGSFMNGFPEEFGNVVGLYASQAVGFNGSAVGGIEYFPIVPLGFFVEGGYRTNFLNVSYRVPVVTEVLTTLEERTQGTWLKAPIMNFGVRIAL